MKQFIVQLLLFLSFLGYGQDQKTKVVVFEIKEEIAPSATRIAVKAVKYAEEIKADYIILHLNTYGGYVTDADSIRTYLLNTKIPVYVFIDNNAASAGALISLACDKIYMRPGGSIGAATVVTQSGDAAPDKYQSYMRKQMRSTAESHGYDTIINGTDTTLRYKRNPDIAEGMVDESIVVPGIDDSSKVITLTTDEALKWGYCEGKAESIEDVLNQNAITDYELIKVEKSSIDKIVSFFANPALRSVLILLMIGGIYFELQSPGIGFALAVAILAAVAYFAPLYLEGLASNWEILLFVVGLILIGLELFVIPGFGIAGISGIAIVLTSLVLSLVKNVNFDFSLTGTAAFTQALSLVFIAFVAFIVVILLFGRSFINSRFFQKIVLVDTLGQSKVVLNDEVSDLNIYLHQHGVCHTALRPVGKIIVDDIVLDAKTYGEFMDKGEKVIIQSIESQYLIVKKG